MATKDYVKRGRSPKPATKKGSPSAKKAPTTSRFPTKWAITAVILVVGFISSLFFLSGTEVPDKPAPKTEAPVVVKPQPKKPEQKALIPPKPEEKWRYIHELENKKIIVPDENDRPKPVKPPVYKKPEPKKETVQVSKPAPVKPEKQPVEAKPEKPTPVKPVAKKPTANNERFVLQCGAYRNQAQADKRKVAIAFQGLNSQLRTTNDAKGTWYRVILGPYSSKNNAKKDKAKLESNGISPCGIWHWQ